MYIFVVNPIRCGGYLQCVTIITSSFQPTSVHMKRTRRRWMRAATRGCVTCRDSTRQTLEHTTSGNSEPPTRGNTVMGVPGLWDVSYYLPCFVLTYSPCFLPSA